MIYDVKNYLNVQVYSWEPSIPSMSPDHHGGQGFLKKEFIMIKFVNLAFSYTQGCHEKNLYFELCPNLTVPAWQPWLVHKSTPSREKVPFFLFRPSLAPRSSTDFYASIEVIGLCHSASWSIGKSNNFEASVEASFLDEEESLQLNIEINITLHNSCMNPCHQQLDNK